VATMPRRYWIYITVFVVIILLAAAGMWQAANAQGAPFDCAVEATGSGGFVLRCEPEATAPATATTTPTSAPSATATPQPSATLTPVIVLPTWTGKRHGDRHGKRHGDRHGKRPHRHDHARCRPTR
jgi:hypothetical protein